MTSIKSYRDWEMCPCCGTPGALYEKEGNPFYHCSSCGYAQFFNPAPGALGVIENDRGEVLLLERARSPHKGTWTGPGGFLEAGEKAEDAVRREVLEETGLKVRGIEYLHTFPGNYGHWSRPTVTIAFLVTSYSGEIRMSEENSSWGWFSYDNLPHIALKDIAAMYNFRAQQLRQRKGRP